MSGTKEKQSQSTTRESPIRILDPDGQSFAVRRRNQHLQALSLALLGNYKLILPLQSTRGVEKDKIIRQD